MAEAAPAPAPRSGLELLDTDALHAVLSLLDCAALAATAAASRAMRAAAVDDRLWAALLAEAFWDASLHPVTKIVKGWPKLWANFRVLLGIFGQSVGPSLTIWANPVQFSLPPIPAQYFPASLDT
jgi:hypothetical protein